MTSANNTVHGALTDPLFWAVYQAVRRTDFRFVTATLEDSVTSWAVSVAWFVQKTTPGYPTSTCALQNYLRDISGR